MRAILEDLIGAIGAAFIPHHKEDAFRSLLAGAALKSGWKVAEPRQANSKTVPPSQIAVYVLNWDGKRVLHAAALVPCRGSSKPDIRIQSPNLDGWLVGEIKAGMSGTAAEGNSNHSKVAADIDLVATGEADFFCGLFDDGMLDRIQGRLSSAGRGFELQVLLGDCRMNNLDTERYSFIHSSWNGVQLRAVIRAVKSAGCEKLMFCFVQKAGSPVGIGDEPVPSDA